MPTVQLRFYEELNDFLPLQDRKKWLSRPFDAGATAGEVVGALGVPLDRIDLLLVNGEPADFSRKILDGDRVGVYPVFESLDIGPATRLPGRPLRDIRFVADVHLGKLARQLRLLGFDCLYRNDSSDNDLIAVMKNEGRVVLTRDRRLLGRKAVSRGYCVRSEMPGDQALEVVRRFDLSDALRPFTLCMECNLPLAEVGKEEIVETLPPLVRRDFEKFHQCPGCKRNYWQGSHFDGMRRFVDEVRRESAIPPPADAEAETASPLQKSVLSLPKEGPGGFASGRHRRPNKRKRR
ncbi:MAG: Mut7-C ubiquitin/RNAse domain-containing protein [Nitrospinae bacterium]|nr:Mut7-C ubiquitin/RNAse domain-containing protein [Nitrospinota bacterium]